jgi:hypothetical protein
VSGRSRLAVLLIGPLILATAAAFASPRAGTFRPGDAPAALTGRHAFFVSPAAPRPGQPLRVLAAFEADAAKVRILLRAPSGETKPLASRRGGGPPYWVAAEFGAAPPGPYDVVLAEGRDEIAAGPAGRLDPAEGWRWAADNLYAAWIEALFAESDERSSWPALHEVTRDRGRNLLHDRLGLGEDEAPGPNALEMTPDCADNPYFLRSYFAWKLGLPFGFHETSWGTLELAPRAGRFVMAPIGSSGAPGLSVPAMERFLNLVKDVVHAGNGRTALGADGTDYYPVALTRRDLKPGTVFADPYGHTYTLVRWVPEPPPTAPRSFSIP